MSYRHLRLLRSRNQRRTLLAATVAGFLGLLSPAANAQLPWDGGITGGPAGGSGAWDSSTTSWWDSVNSLNVAWTNPVNTTLVATFGGTGGNVAVTGPVTANGLVFNSNNYILSGTGLTLGGAATISVTNLSDTATINTVIDGTAGLTYSGLGKLVLGGNNAALSGAINVNSGILSIAADNNLGLAANAVSIAGGGSLQYTGATATSTRAVTIGTGGGTIDVTTGANTLTLSTGLGTSANVLTKTGAGTLSLTATSARTGATTIDAGKLSATVLTALGSGAVTVSGTGNYELNTAAGTSGQVINVNNGGTFTWAPNLQLTLGPALNLTGTGGTVFVGGTGSTGKLLVNAGLITSASGSTLTKTGGGVMQLAGANTGFAGNVALTAGTIEFQNVDSLGTAVKTVTISGTGDFATGGVTNRNNVVLSGGILSANNAAANYTGAVTATAATTSTIQLRQFQSTGTATSFRIDGNISGSGTLNVAAPAAATLTLGTTPNTAGAATNNTGFTGVMSVGSNATVVVNQRLGTGSAITLAGGAVQYRAPNLASATAGSSGLTGTYYNFGSNVGTTANNFAVDQLYLSPRTFSRNDANVNMPQPGANGNSPLVPVLGYAMGVGAQGQQDGAMWKGLINITTAGTYQFSSAVDDSDILYIDGNLVGSHASNTGGATTNIGSGVVLSAGLHSIVYKMTQGGGGGYSTLSYNGGAGSDAPTTTLIPASAFSNGSLAAAALGPVTVTATSTLDIAQPSSISTLSLGNATLNVTSATIDDITVAATTITAATPTLAPASGGLIFAGPIGENAAGRALNIAGPYSTEFQATNTYTGTTTVTGGQLRLNAASNSIAGNLTINAGNANGHVANVRLLQSNQIANTATVTMTSGILDIGAFNDTVNNLAVNGGQILGTSGVLTVTNAPTLTAGYIGASLAGNYTLAKTGAGTAALGGANTYTGLTNVNVGILQVRGGGTLGAGGAGNETNVASGATLQLVGSSTATENITLNGTGVTEVIQNGALRNVGGISQINNLTTGSSANIGVDAGQVIVNGTLDLSNGSLTKTGVGVLTFASNQATLPAVNLNGGALGFSGPQSFGTATVPTNYAFQFDSDPGAGVTAVTVGGSAAIIGNYAINNSFIAKIHPTSLGTLLLGADNGNALSLAPVDVALGAKGLVNYTGTLTPNAIGYRFGGVAGQGAGLNELTVSSALTGANSLTVSGGTINLEGNNTQTGNVNVTGGTLRYINDQNLGAAANVVSLNGGTLQIATNADSNGGASLAHLGNPLNGLGATGRVISVDGSGGTIDVPARQAQGNFAIVTVANGLIGNGQLTKTGLGLLGIETSNSFNGNLVIAANGNRVDLRGSGSLPNVSSVIINQSGRLDIDNNSTFASRQFALVDNRNRLNDSATITLNGGTLRFVGRNVAFAAGSPATSQENFGTINAGIGQSALNATRTGNGGADMVISNLARVTGSTVMFTTDGNTLGQAGDNPRIILSQINGVAPTVSSFVGGWATVNSADFAAYGANSTVGGVSGTATGITNYGSTGAPTYTALTTTTAPGSGGFVATNTGSAAASLTLGTPGAAQSFSVNALRLANSAALNLTFLNTTNQDTLYVQSGGIITSNNNNATTIGIGGAALTTNSQGILTAGPATGNASARELFLHNNQSTLTVFSKITDNNSQPVSLVKGLDGAVTLTPNVNISTTWAVNVNSFTVADTTLLRVGQPIIGVAGASFIASITGPTTFTANAAPTAASATAFLNYGTPNTFTGGVYVNRGQLNSSAVGALGDVLTTSTPTVNVKNSILSLNTIGGVSGTVPGGYSGPVYAAVDQGTILLNAGSNTAAGMYTVNTDRFSIGTGSTIANPGAQAAGGFNSLTRIATENSFTAGGQVYLAPGAIVRHNLSNAPDQGTGTLTIKNLGTNADLYFAPGSFGGVLQTVTLGAGTPWVGMSSDRGNLTWNSGTIYANSDFALQGLTRDGGVAALILGANTTAANNQGGLSIVNNSNGPIRASVIGNVVINEDEPVFQPSNLTYVLTPGSLFQPNTSMAMGFGANQAKILVQAGGTLDPGNFVAIGAAANTNRNLDGSVIAGNQNLPYALPSPVNGQLTVETGGRFLINDTSGIGSAPVGSWTMQTGSILDLGSANAFFGRGAYGLTQTGPVDTTGVIQNGQFVYENGVIVRIQADNIYKLSQFLPGTSQAPVIEIFNANRTLTSQNNPFIISAVGTTTIAPENITLGSGAIVTNDSNDRTLVDGRGKVILQNGAILAATSQTVFNVQEGLEVAAGATINVGQSNLNSINGNPKTGLVQFSGPQSNVFGAGAKLVVADGSGLGMSAQNSFPDNGAIELTAAVTTLAPAGAAGFNPGNGSILLPNVANFAEIVGPLTGDGSVIANAGATYVGVNATSNFTSNVRFRAANGQQANLWKVGSGTMTYTGSSDSTGQVWVGAGELKYSGAGNSLFGENRVQKGGTLTLDNSGTALNNRLGGTTKGVSPMGGTLNLVGNATTPVEERLGTLFNSASNQASFIAVPGVTTLKVTPGAEATTLFVNTAERFDNAGIGTQRSGVYIVNTPTAANAPITYLAGGGFAGGIVPGTTANSNGLLQIANPGFTSGNANGSVFGVQAGGVYGSAGTPVAATRGDYLGDADGNGIADGFMTQDGVFLPVTNTLGTAVLTGLPTTTGLMPGMLVQSGNVPAGTRILTVDGPTGVTLTANTITAAPTTMQFISGGMRNLTAAEYSATMRDGFTTGINVKLAGTTSTRGDTRFSSLTMTPGSSLSIDGTLPNGLSGSRTIITGGGIFVQSGGTAATINGSPFGASRAFLQTLGGTSLYLHAQGDLNINAAVFTDNAIVKTGAGTVTFGDHALDAFRGSLQIDAGTVTLGTNNTMSNTRSQSGSTANNFYVNGGTLNLGGNSQMINVLANNNELPGMGGTITSTPAATLTITGGGRFSGSIGGAISIDKNANNTLLLTSSNTYTGTTLVRAGTLALRDSGTLAGTSSIDVRYGTLLLDNSYLSSINNRVAPTVPVTLRGATINLTGAAGQLTTQTHNLVTLAEGRNDINSNAGGSGANELTIGNLVRTANSGAVVSFNQSYGFLGAAGNTTAIRDIVTNINGSAPVLTNNILPSWIIANGDHFATYNATTGVSYLGNTADGYAAYDSTDASTATTNQNVNDGTARTFAATKTINAWRMAPGANITNTYNTGVGLTIGSGGLIGNSGFTVTHAAAADARSNFITSGTGELMYWVNQNTHAINIPITGSIDLVKSGAGTLNLGASSLITGTVAAGNSTITMTNTTGLEVGDPITAGTASTFPAGTVITAINPGVSITVSNPAGVAGADFRVTLGNTYTGTTYVNSGTLTLNQLAASPTARAINGDLVIQGAATIVTEANAGQQFNPTANLTIGGGGRLNLANVAGITETLNSITFLDGAGATATAQGVDRTGSQLTSTLNLAAATAIVSNNTNPSTGVPTIGGNLGNLAFTNAGGATLNINSPVAVNGVLAVGLRMNSRIGSVPTLAEGGLIKSGTGLLTLDPDTNPTFAATGSTTVGSPIIPVSGGTAGMYPGMQVSGTNIPTGSYIISVDNANQITINTLPTAAGVIGTITGGSTNFTGALTSAQDVLNVQSGIVRADRHGSLGGPLAVTTVQSGATLLGANSGGQVITGSVTLKSGSTLGATINAFTLGAATDIAANQTVLSVPSGTVNIAAYDYFLPASNNGNITVNGRLTGSGTINLVGSQLTQGSGGGGVLTLGNPILSGTGSNDYNGTINVGINAMLQNQVALIAKNTSVLRTSGNALGAATINLAGGRLRLRDDATTGAAVSNTTVNYGNNVTLSADSFLDSGRVNTTDTNSANTIDLGTLTVAGPLGTSRTLTVDSNTATTAGAGLGNYLTRFSSLDGAGTLVKAGAGRLQISSISGSFTGGIAIAAPFGNGVAPAVSTNGSTLILPATSNVASFTVGGLYTTEASKTLNISGTLAVNSNAGDATRGLHNNNARLAVTNSTVLSIGALQNNGAVGPLGGATTITAPGGFSGNGTYVTTNAAVGGAVISQPLTLAGNVTGGNLRTAGLNTVTLTGTANTLGAGAQVQGGTLSLAPAANAATSGTITVFGVPAVTATPTASPIAAVNGVLDFKAPAANTITHTGNIENSGLVRASTGSAVVTGSINGSAGLRYTPGLMEGLVMGTTVFTVDNTRPANPGNFGVQTEPRMLQSNIVTQQALTGHLDNEVWVYNGYVKDDDGIFSFAGAQDDNLGVWINGALVLNSGGNVTGSTALKHTQANTGVVTPNGNSGTPSQNFGPGITIPGYGSGWYEVEIRMRNGTGGAGPYTAGPGFTTNYGFGYKNGIGALDGSDYIKPVDDGTGNLFVTPVGSKGNITVQSAASLTAGGFTQIAATKFGDTTQGGGTSTFNVTANATPVVGITGGNDTDTLSVVTPTSTTNTANFNLASGIQAVVRTSTTVDNGQTLNVGVSGVGGGRVVLPATSTLALNGSLNITGSGTASGPTVMVNVPAGSSTGSGATVVSNGGIIAGSGSLPTAGTLSINAGGTLSPGNSPGILGAGNTTWQSSGNYNWQMLDATGAAGTGFDQFAVTGTLTVGAGFNFNLWSLSSASPDTNGFASNFINTNTQYWVVATTTAGGFTAGDLAGISVNTAAMNGTGGFTNPLGTGSFSLIQGGSGAGVPGTLNDVVLKFTASVATGNPDMSVGGVTGGDLFVLQNASLTSATASVSLVNGNTNTGTVSGFTTSQPTILTASTGQTISGAGPITPNSVISLLSTSTNTTALGATVTFNTSPTDGNIADNVATVNVRIGNAPLHPTASSTTFGTALIAATPISGTPYTNLSSNTIGQTSTGTTVPALGTTATILLYTNSTGSDTGVSMAWRSRKPSEASTSEPGGLLTNRYLVSDVVNLTGMVNSTGTKTDTFVLQMSYNEALLNGFESATTLNGTINIVSNNGVDWVNATDLNILPDTGSTVNNYINDFDGAGPNAPGSWANFVAQYGVTAANLNNFIGSWGVDQVNNQAWAVLDHNSEFAVIPEPSTLVLGGLALLGFAGVGIRRRRLAKEQQA